MTRIIAGLARGRRLAVPPTGTRPTSDRAREGLFNSLATLLDLDGARVLDLYAGSGAVGLEALSRGAAVAVLVESARGPADTIAANIAKVGLPGAELRRSPVATALAGAPTEPFDVAFLDPPYDCPDSDVADVLTALADRWLAPGAVVVAERAVRGDPPTWPTSVTPLRERRYGEAMLWYGRAR